MTQLEKALAEYRKQNPKSRAVKGWLNAGGGTQRQYVCTFCRRTIDTESAGYPMTKHAKKNIAEHAGCSVEQAYAREYDAR